MKLSEFDFSELLKWEKVWEKIIAILPSVIWAIVILAVGFYVANLLGRILFKAMSPRIKDPTIVPFLKSVVVIFLKFAVILAALDALHINVNSIIAAVSAAGVTAGIGLKDNIAQFAAGLQILISKPFKSGDYIEVNGLAGTVGQIRFMNTSLNTIDNKRVIMPNSQIMNNSIINYTAEDYRRLDLVYTIGYNDDIVIAKNILAEIAREDERVLDTPAPMIGVKEHGAHGIHIACQIWCSSENYWPLFYSMQEKVKNAFDEHGISIPYDQLDVHVVSDDK